VKTFQPMDTTTAYVLGSDGNLWRETMPAPTCKYTYDSADARLVGGSAPFIAAWGATPTSGTCSDVRGTGGTWKQIVPSDATPVPHDTTVGASPDCSTVLPAGCCTYVWWPDSTAMQDPSVLCGVTSSLVALGETGWDCPDGTYGDCPHPAGGQCDTCLLDLSLTDP
jgi:hypothetical protein